MLFPGAITPPPNCIPDRFAFSSLAAFLPLRRPRLVVADDDGGLAVYRLADGGRCGLLYRCWPLLPDGARMAGLTHPIGLFRV